MDDYGVGDQFKATEPLTFSIMMLSNPDYPYKADWPFFTELAKRTNVTLEPHRRAGQRLQPEAQRRWSARGNAPMIIPKTYHPDEEAYIAGGAILPVSDYLDLMPNFTGQGQASGTCRATSTQFGQAGRQVLPAARPARGRLAGLLAGDAHRHPAPARPAGAEDVGRADHRCCAAMKAGLPRPVPVLRPVEHPAAAGRQQPARHPQPRRTARRPAGPSSNAYWDAGRRQVRLHRRHGPVQADAAVPQHAGQREAAGPGELHPDRRQRPAEVRHRQVVRDQLQRPDAGQRAAARTSRGSRARRWRRSRCRPARWAPTQTGEPGWRTAS